MNAGERLKKIEQIVEDYENENGVPKIVKPTYSLELYLNMSRQELNSLSAQDCGEIAYLLGQYSYYIQRLQNKHQGNKIWAEGILQEDVCKYLGDYSDFIKYEIKVKLIAKENQHITDILKIMNYADIMGTRLNFISSSISNLSHIISNLEKSKRYNKDRYE